MSEITKTYQNPRERAALLAEAVQEWLDGSESGLNRAIQKTADEGLFPEHDIRFALDHIRRSVTPESLTGWVNESFKKPVEPELVLVLHAGNLPLVGFQDILGVLLSGHYYRGKLSRKDPYLAASFLKTAGKFFPNEMIQYSTSLDFFNGLKAHKVMFTGSEKTYPVVRERLAGAGMMTEGADLLIRTAHKSVAVFENPETIDWQCLTEAILRYEGRGCRSVIEVFSTISLEEAIPDLEFHINNFLESNPASTGFPAALKFEMAYFSAVGISHLSAGRQLITSKVRQNQDGLIIWNRVDNPRVSALHQKGIHGLQSVYSTNPADEFESLSEAQTPPVNWKPDGADTLSWLTSPGTK